MSSFLVSDSLINKIATLVTAGSRMHDYRHCFHGTKFYDQSTIDPQELADALYLMNCDALDARYSGGTAPQDTAAKVGLVRFVHINAVPVALYKGIQCYLYQCSEGDVSESPLYQAIESVKAQLADSIIKNTFEKQYNDASWGS